MLRVLQFRMWAFTSQPEVYTRAYHSLCGKHRIHGDDMDFMLLNINDWA